MQVTPPLLTSAPRTSQPLLPAGFALTRFVPDQPWGALSGLATGGLLAGALTAGAVPAGGTAAADAADTMAADGVLGQVAETVSTLLGNAAQGGGEGIGMTSGLFDAAIATVSIARAGSGGQAGDHLAVSWLKLAGGAFRAADASGLLHAWPTIHGGVAVIGELCGMVGEAMRQMETERTASAGFYKPLAVGAMPRPVAALAPAAPPSA